QETPKIEAVVEAPEEQAPVTTIDQTKEVDTTTKEAESVAIDNNQEFSSPKLTGPKEIGKINLDELNLNTRPKKVSAKEKQAEQKSIAQEKYKKENNTTTASRPAILENKKKDPNAAENKQQPENPAATNRARRVTPS